MGKAVTRHGVDSWTDSDAPSQNKGQTKFLWVQAPGTATKYSYLWLKDAPPKNSTIETATLYLYELGSFGSSVTINVKLIADPWVESTINYNNAPATTGSVASLTLTGSADATEWAVDVTTLMQAVADGTPFYGFRIATTSTTVRKFYGLQASDHRPRLVTEWSDDPDTPTGLAPSGGSAVSIAKPTLVYNYHDPNASDLTSHRIQIKDANTGWDEDTGFAAPDFDSGEVATDDPEYDTSTGSFAGIGAGDDLWWTVQVKNASGRWSTWADPVTFTRVNKINVTLDNPAVAPNNFVSDTTPEFFWTATGQVARRIILSNVTNDPDVDPTVPLWDTGRIHTTEESWTPPDGLINDENATYRIDLRVHDDDTRTTTPGDTVYIQEVRDFTFVEDATPDPVTSLTAAQVASGRPNVRLTWQRSTAPDAYSVWRDGRHIATVDPADAFVSGTTYSLVDNLVWPHVSHTWKVRCRVDGVLGPGPTVTYSYETPVAWLIDPDTTRLVPLLKPEWQFDMPETGATFSPIDGDTEIQIIQGQQGLRGTVTAFLEDWAGLDAADVVADMKWMKKRPEGVRRLILGAQNLPVVIRNVVIAPSNGGGPDDRAVSFTFSARGGPR